MINKEEKDKSCLFCEIVNKKRKSKIIFENDYAVAFLDIFPIEKGHCLIISKRCVPNITVLEEREMLSIYQLMQKICKTFPEKLKCNGFNLLNNFNKIAGQIINHFHIHIIPKYKEGYGFTWKKNKSFYNEKLESVWKKIKGRK